MIEKITDEELLNLISNIEENDLVKAPPELEKRILDRFDQKDKVIEFKRFRNRVIAAVVAILIIIPFAPYMVMKEPVIKTNVIDLGNSHYISDLLNGREE